MRLSYLCIDKAGGVGKQAFGLGDDRLDNARSRGRVADQSNGFTHENAGFLGIPLRKPRQ